MWRTTMSCLVALAVWLCATFAAAVPNPRDVVMYEVNLRAFSQAGDLAGVTARLDNIQELGVNVIWLMPIHPIGVPNRVGPLGSPYSVQDYRAVSNEYGTLSDLTTLIGAAHDRGMYVIMDWVANHTAWDHAWVTNNPNWYTQNAQGQIVHPPGTNWQDVADLNFDNSAMRAAMISDMQYWVSEVGIDGFRCDAADFVPFSFWQEAVPAVRSATDRPLLMLAEGARTNHFTAGFDLTFGWNFYSTVRNVFNSSASAINLRNTYNSTIAQVPAGKSVLHWTTNHDESAWDATPPVIFGSLEASLAAFAVTVAYGGVPLVYNGQEIGWSQNVPFFSKSPLNWNSGQATADWYAKLLGVYNDREALRSGSLTDQSNANVAMLLREHEGDQVLVLVNTRNSVSQINIPVAWRGEWVNQLDGIAKVLATTHSLAPYEVLILAAAPALAGDFNNDGVVDAADYTVWRNHLDETNEANINNNGDGNGVGQSDYTLWKSHYGNSNPGSGSGGLLPSAVPEPTSLALLMLAATGWCVQRGPASSKS